jgi:hypothetical protein
LRERDKQKQVIPSKSQQQQQQQQQQQACGAKDLTPGSATPQRSSYVLVVEVTMKVGVSFTFLPLSKQPQRSLEFSTNLSFPLRK